MDAGTSEVSDSTVQNNLVHILSRHVATASPSLCDTCEVAGTKLAHGTYGTLTLIFSLFILWQGDPIPEEIYELLSDSSLRSIRDLQQVLRIDSVGKSPQH